jgi:hypothetical protein
MIFHTPNAVGNVIGEVARGVWSDGTTNILGDTMRKWLLEETGEYREANPGETGTFEGRFTTFHVGSICKYHILKVTELFDDEENHPLTDRFDEFNW